MVPGILGWVNAHHGDAADPDLMGWIKHRLDDLVGLEPWVIVAVLSLLMVAIPVSIMLFYAIQRRRIGPDTR
jgi:hypothetical protein